jgi:hypothetical protein
MGLTRLASLLLTLLLVGCGASVQAGLTDDETRWCDSTDPSVMLEAGVEIGVSRQEMLLVLDDVDLTGRGVGREDPRWVRVCQHAYARR